MKFGRYLSASMGSLAIAGLLVIACSDDATTTPSGTGGSDAGRDVATTDVSQPDTSTVPVDAGLDSSKPDVSQPGVTVNVTYAGTKMGNLTIALFAGSSPPPVPPPAALAQVVGPVFPVSKKFMIAPGSYLVTSYIDVGGNNVAGPGPEDPRTGAPKVVTFAGADVSVDVVINDPDGG